MLHDICGMQYTSVCECKCEWGMSFCSQVRIRHQSCWLMLWHIHIYICHILHTTYIMQHTTYHIHHVTYLIHHRTYHIEHAICRISHTPCNIAHTAYHIHHPAYCIPHISCNCRIRIHACFRIYIWTHIESPLYDYLLFQRFWNSHSHSAYMESWLHSCSEPPVKKRPPSF